MLISNEFNNLQLLNIFSIFSTDSVLKYSKERVVKEVQLLNIYSVLLTKEVINLLEKYNDCKLEQLLNI